MKRLSLVTSMGLLLGPWFEPSAALARGEELSSLLSMIEAGVPDKAIEAYVDAGDLHLALSAEDLLSLRRAGASADLLVFLLERSRAAGPPVSSEGAELIYEYQGVRAFRQTTPSGKEVIVVSNLDERGRRTDRPPEVPAEAPPAERAPSAPAPPSEALAETSEPVEPSELSQPEPAYTRRRIPPSPTVTRRGMIYVGPFYQFAPSNVPGPSSPWSPVFQVVPVFWGGFPFGVPVYPFARLGAVYPPGSSSFFCIR